MQPDPVCLQLWRQHHMIDRWVFILPGSRPGPAMSMLRFLTVAGRLRIVRSAARAAPQPPRRDRNNDLTGTVATATVGSRSTHPERSSTT